MTNPFDIEEYLKFTDDRLHGEIRELGDYLAYIRKDVLKFKSQTKLVEYLGLKRDRTWISRFENTQASKYTFPPPGYVATLFVSIVKRWQQVNQLVDLKIFLLSEFGNIWEHNRNEWKNELQAEINEWSDIEHLSGGFLESQKKPRDDIQSSQEPQIFSADSIPSHQANNLTNYDLSIVPAGVAPAPPKLFVGRENDIAELRHRLTSETNTTLLTAVRGWPGIGKTSLAATLAHDPMLNAAFPDGVLWTALGPSPKVDVELGNWLTALGLDPRDFPTSEARSNRLAAILHHKKLLLIIDDVWEAAHAQAFLIGGRNCRTLITTREPQVAHILGLPKQAIYKLLVLSDEESLNLLQQLAPKAVKSDLEGTHRLIESLEGLPLALHVAGRLLDAEAEMGWGIADLLEELAEGTRLLQEIAPADRTDLATQTTPTIAVLLENSTNRLDPITRERFALLGHFVPKPATFDVPAVAAAWGLDDPRPTLRELRKRGLVEPATEGWFQMHALLATHAKSMWETKV